MKILIHSYLPQHLSAISPVQQILEERGHMIVFTEWSKDNWVPGTPSSWAPKWDKVHIPNADMTIIAHGPDSLELPRPIVIIPHGCGVLSPGITSPVHGGAQLGIVQGSIHYEQCCQYPSNQKFAIVGWPKLDTLTNKDPLLAKNIIIEKY